MKVPKTWIDKYKKPKIFPILVQAIPVDNYACKVPPERRKPVRYVRSKALYNILSFSYCRIFLSFSDLIYFITTMASNTRIIKSIGKTTKANDFIRSGAGK